MPILTTRTDIQAADINIDSQLSEYENYLKKKKATSGLIGK